MTIRENNKKLMKNEYFIEISCKIDKLLWMFCKSDGVNSGGATMEPKGA